MGRAEGRMEKKHKRDEIIMKERNWELQFPDEIVQLIISKLPFPNLHNCSLVCKSWNNLVSTCKCHPSNLFFASISTSPKYLHCVDLDPKHLEGISSVASLHLEGIPSVASLLLRRPKYSKGYIKNTVYEKLSPSSVSIINSCAGLLAVNCRFYVGFDPASVEDYSYLPCIFNPMTNECIKLPPPLSPFDSFYYYGLGFSPKTKQYKMVRISCLDDESASSIEIFAIGTSSQWTHVEFIPASVGNHANVYFNGSLYWNANLIEDGPDIIYRLDIESEKLDQISFPQNAEWPFFLGVMDGTLYLTARPYMCSSKYHVWKMEEDFSWTKLFILSGLKKLPRPKPRESLETFKLQLIKSYEDGKILCLYSGIHLILDDPTTKKRKMLTNQDVEITKCISIHRIEYLHFNSLHSIFAGNC